MRDSVAMWLRHSGKRIQVISAAPDERDFYALKSLHFEKLQGKREGEHSMRLNDQWRLVLKFKAREQGKTVVVISIEDYH
jgi:proteic killer suppression protein